MKSPAVRRIALVFALACAAVAPSCSTAVESPIGPSAAPGSSNALTAGQLSGTWNLASMQIGGKTQPAPLNAVYSLTFAEDRISTRVDCNICGGPFRVSGDQVTIGPNLACTRAACATMEFESAYQSVLAGDSTARLDGASLVISSARGSLTFAR